MQNPRRMNRRLKPIHALIFALLREFNDKYSVLRGQSDQDDEADVDQDVAIKPSYIHANHGGQDAHWNDKNHRKRQGPALVEGREQQVDKGDRQPKGYDRGAACKLLLQSDLRPLE